jgi:glycopeptide antibiotics resistance protein
MIPAPHATEERVKIVSVPFAIAAVLYLALVSFITLGSVPWNTASNESEYGVLSASAWVDPATWSSGSSFEFLANIAMFIPIGLLMRVALPALPGGVIVIFAVLITVAIELAQIPLDRVSDPRDLVANSIGAVVGVLAVSGFSPRTSPTGH